MASLIELSSANDCIMRRTPPAGTISGTMNVNIQLDDPLKLNISKGSAITKQCLRDDKDAVPSRSKYHLFNKVRGASSVTDILALNNILPLKGSVDTISVLN